LRLVLLSVTADRSDGFHRALLSIDAVADCSARQLRAKLRSREQGRFARYASAPHGLDKPIGVGPLQFHNYLQTRTIPFDAFMSGARAGVLSGAGRADAVFASAWCSCAALAADRDAGSPLLASDESFVSTATLGTRPADGVMWGLIGDAALQGTPKSGAHDRLLFRHSRPLRVGTAVSGPRLFG